MTVLVQEQTQELKTVFPGQRRELTLETAIGFERAREIYEMSVPRIAYRLDQAPDDFATELANLAGEGDRRVRAYLRRFARRDWKAFETKAVAPIDMIDHIDIRWGGKVGWITTTKYLNSHRTVVIRNKPLDIDDALAKLREVTYTVRAYGAGWYRAWPGRPSPVRTTQEILKARQDMANGRFYIPEDYHVAPGMVNLAYDL